MLWKVVFQCYEKNRVLKFPGNLASTKIVWILEISHYGICYDRARFVMQKEMDHR